MRESCLNCARKHLAQAVILMTEACLGYPDHKWIAIGHMCEAETELVEDYLVEAIRIREHRKAYEQDEGYVVPIMELIQRLGKLDNGEKETVSSPEV